MSWRTLDYFIKKKDRDAKKQAEQEVEEQVEEKEEEVNETDS